MALGCLRLVLSHAARAAHLTPPQPHPHLPLSVYLGVALQQWTHFCTSVGEGEEASESQPQQQKKKQDPKARVSISSVGRKIYSRHLQLLGEDGGDLGVKHRAEALRLMDESGLKLVPVNQNSEPPVYRLMSGKQIHEEQMKLREKQKAKAAGIVQVKELTLSSDIAPHDLDTKLRQVVNWLEKKHHIRLTLKATRNSRNETALDVVLDQMVEKMAVPVGFVSKTRLVREGRAAMCVLRPPSAKELQGAQQAARNPANTPQSEPGKQEVSSESDQSKDSDQH